MRIKVNEKFYDEEQGATLYQLKERYKADADILIYNGFPASNDLEVHEGDMIQLIRRGETPRAEDLESLLVARHTPGVHEKVKSAVVGVAGLGGLGSPCAMALCRMGIGKLILVDFDVVEPSNLNRQCYFIDQIGMYKSEATRRNLERINPYVRTETHNLVLDESNIPVVFREASIVIEAFDRADMKAMIIRTVLSSMPHATVISASGIAGYGPGDEIRVLRLAPRLYVIGDSKSEARPGMGLMAPRVGIAAHQQANTAIRIILGQEE
jgi:sulfur carrier protein ThiS adenylyltransferase